MVSKAWVINIFLMLTIGFVSINIWDIWQKETVDLPGIVSGKKDTIAPKKRKILKDRLKSASEYEAIVDNNLFAPNRMANIQAPDESLMETDETVRIDGEKVMLYGVIILDDYKKALINNPYKKKDKRDQLWIVEGERVGDLKVLQIGQDQILLSDGIKNYNISLYDPKKRKKLKSKSQKSKAPQVISAGGKAGSSGKKSRPAYRKAKSSKADLPKKHKKVSESDDGKFEIIDTPFGKIKRRIK